MPANIDRSFRLYYGPTLESAIETLIASFLQGMKLSKRWLALQYLEGLSINLIDANIVVLSGVNLFLNFIECVKSHIVYREFLIQCKCQGALASYLN